MKRASITEVRRLADEYEAACDAVAKAGHLTLAPNDRARLRGAPLEAFWALHREFVKLTAEVLGPPKVDHDVLVEAAEAAVKLLGRALEVRPS